MEVVSIMGVIQEENESGGLLVTKIQGTKTTIMIIMMSSSAVKLVVKARKAFFPNIRVAQDVYIKIDNYLKDK